MSGNTALIILTVVTLLSPHLAHSQNDSTATRFQPVSPPLQECNFRAVDQYALSPSFKKNKDIRVLASTLTAPFTMEVEKVRAIFIWVAHNIAYDCKAYHNMESDNPAEFPDASDYRLAETVLKKKKGVCSDYALLFRQLCIEAGIESEIVDGYAFDEYNPKPHKLSYAGADHAWNAVRINGYWHLVDATWAAGWADDNCSSFTFDYADYYFLPSPDMFIHSHFPLDEKWQLLQKPITSDEFLKLAALSPE